MFADTVVSTESTAETTNTAPLASKDLLSTDLIQAEIDQVSQIYKIIVDFFTNYSFQ